jgi:hypothetical protein
MELYSWGEVKRGGMKGRGKMCKKKKISSFSEKQM